MPIVALYREAKRENPLFTSKDLTELLTDLKMMTVQEVLTGADK